jgi:hypothetical protein
MALCVSFDSLPLPLILLLATLLQIMHRFQHWNEPPRIQGRYSAVFYIVDAPKAPRHMASPPARRSDMRQYFSASSSSITDNANDGTIDIATFYSTSDIDSDSHPSKQDVQQRKKQLPLTQFARAGKSSTSSTSTQCTPQPTSSTSTQCTQRKRRRLDDRSTHDDERGVLDKSSPPAAPGGSNNEWESMGGTESPDPDSNSNTRLVGEHEGGHGQFIHACVQYQVEGLSDHLTGTQRVCCLTRCSHASQHIDALQCYSLRCLSG